MTGSTISQAGYLQMAKDALVIADGPYSMTLGELESIISRYRVDVMTADDYTALAVESSMQLIIGAEDHNPTKLAQAAGRALICDALRRSAGADGLRCAVDAHEYMRLNA